MAEPLSWSEFRALPRDTIQTLVPKSVVCTLGGTRRAAAFAGIQPSSIEYIHWSRQHMLTWFDIFAKYGVEHIFLAATRVTEFKEQGRHAQILSVVDNAIADDAMLHAYACRQWRTRVIGDPASTFIQGITDRFSKNQPPHYAMTLWYMIVPSFDAIWDWMCQAIVAATATTRQAAMHAFYGEAIPPAKLLISFGKPVVSADLIPPLISDELQCYWSQKPGYSLGEDDFLSIMYDFAYMRATWRENKTGRAEEALLDQTRWNSAGIVGLGQRLGPFWFPRHIDSET
ncbi:MAG: hypothetical protein H0T53_03215 [Herpetosiphonaceae bacterium]|nr:hypothetical protein [Herpetosiphonaceae bacterium]